MVKYNKFTLETNKIADLDPKEAGTATNLFKSLGAVFPNDGLKKLYEACMVENATDENINQIVLENAQTIYTLFRQQYTASKMQDAIISGEKYVDELPPKYDPSNNLIKNAVNEIVEGISKGNMLTASAKLLNTIQDSTNQNKLASFKETFTELQNKTMNIFIDDFNRTNISLNGIEIKQVNQLEIDDTKINPIAFLRKQGLNDEQITIYINAINQGSLSGAIASDLCYTNAVYGMPDIKNNSSINIQKSADGKVTGILINKANALFANISDTSSIPPKQKDVFTMTQEITFNDEIQNIPANNGEFQYKIPAMQGGFTHKMTVECMNGYSIDLPDKIKVSNAEIKSIFTDIRDFFKNIGKAISNIFTTQEPNAEDASRAAIAARSAAILNDHDQDAIPIIRLFDRISSFFHRNDVSNDSINGGDRMSIYSPMQTEQPIDNNLKVTNEHTNINPNISKPQGLIDK